MGNSMSSSKWSRSKQRRTPNEIGYGYAYCFPPDEYDPSHKAYAPSSPAYDADKTLPRYTNEDRQRFENEKRKQKDEERKKRAEAVRREQERIQYLITPMRKETMENALEQLRQYDTAIIVDDSWSMSGINWTEARNALAQLAEVASKYDDNGIDIHFLNSKLQGLNMTSTEAVERLFNSVQPNGITEIGKCLERLMNIYLDELESEEKARVHASEELPTKPLNIIVITDGISSDTVSDVIVGAAKRLDAKHFPLGQLGVQFVQIGDDPEATTFLGELDDELRLEYKIRDMVDTTPYTGRSLTSDMLIKVLLGGINRLVDGKRGASRRV